MKYDLPVAILIIIFGVAYLLGAQNIYEGGGTYSAVGPRIFPTGIGIGIVISGVWLAIHALRKRHPAEIVPLEPMVWRSWLAVAAVFLAYILLLEPLGYLLSTAAFIALESRALGSRAWLRDLVAAIVISGAVYFVFNILLKVGLPTGLLG